MLEFNNQELEIKLNELRINRKLLRFGISCLLQCITNIPSQTSGIQSPFDLRCET